MIFDQKIFVRQKKKGERVVDSARAHTTCKGDGAHAVGSRGSVMRSLSLGRWALVASTLMRTRTCSQGGGEVAGVR